MSSLKYYVWLSCVRGLRPGTAAELLHRFGTAEQVFFAGERDYREVINLSRPELEGLLFKNIGYAGRVIETCREKGYRILTIQDAEYSERLRNIYAPPLVLYVKGTLPPVDEALCIGIVGTRRYTRYGETSAERLGFDLARHGCVVVTGLARGIDTSAARGALRAGGRVIGVLGSGLNTVYPAENRALFRAVSESGALVTEYAPEVPVTKAAFPARNRIISGLSVGVTVVEAPEKSGALITAAHALEQGRDVFVMPGNVNLPSFKGSNALLKEGAFPLTGAEDILREYAGFFTEKPELDPPPPQKTRKIDIDNAKIIEYSYLEKVADSLDGEEKTVFLAIGQSTLHIDEIIIQTGLSTAAVLSALTMLEIKGYIRQETGKLFAVNQS